MKGLKKVLYTTGIIALTSSAYSQTQDSTQTNKIYSGDKVIEEHTITTDLKEAPLDLVNLLTDPKGEIQKFSKYTSEDKEKAANYLVDYIITERENCEKSLADYEMLKIENETLKSDLEKKTKEAQDFLDKYKALKKQVSGDKKGKKEKEKSN